MKSIFISDNYIVSTRLLCY